VPSEQPDEVEIDPADLAATLRVLSTLHTLDHEHADFIAVRHATAHMFRAVKVHRRLAKRAEVADADRAVIEATATGSPDRIDDETRGVNISSSTGAQFAGKLTRSRACYVCKQHYTLVDAFYHQLCPD
jgi:hypothetical protein